VKFREQNLTLFQAGRTLLLQPFYLSQDAGAWIVSDQPQEHAILPHALFSWIQESINKTQQIFSLVARQEHLERYLHSEIWNCMNDYKRGAYAAFLEATSQCKQFLHPSEHMTREFGYQSGYSLYSLSQSNPVDPFQMDLETLELTSSPEAMIEHLSRHNLVFGLSATADIRRKLKAFNLDWLRERLGDAFYEPEEIDIQLIEGLQAKKDQKKYPPEGPAIQLLRLLPEEVNSNLAKVLKEPMKANWYSEVSDQANSAQYRLDRSHLFFNCLEQLLTSSSGRSHLIFMNSFRRERSLFTPDEPELKIWRKQLEAHFQIEEAEDMFVTFRMQGHRARLVFFDAEMARKLEESGQYARYKQSWSDPDIEKVILVSQYQSASNGVNLQCYNTEGIEVDFDGVHLLEAPYFWFNTPDGEHEDFLQQKKSAIWYLWKLQAAGEISEQTFRRMLRQGHLQGLNRIYRHCPEYVLNNISLFCQAFGRIDRKINPVSKIEVGLGPDVWFMYQRFLKEPAYQELASGLQRQRYTATMIQAIHKAIQAELRADSMSLPKPKQSIAHENSRSRRIIEALLKAIEQLKSGQLMPEQGRELRAAWQWVRESVLQQNTLDAFHFEHLKMQTLTLQDLCFEHIPVPQNGQIWLEHILPDEDLPGDWLVHPQRQIRASVQAWDLNQVFWPLLQQASLKQLFAAEGYVTGFVPGNYASQMIWTPYIAQAILKGALGEAAISQLLKLASLPLASPDEQPDRLFEVYDAQLAGLPVFFDFKNYSESSLDRYDEGLPDALPDPDAEPERFLKKVKEKLALIQLSYPNLTCRLVILNLMGSSQREWDLFDAVGKRVLAFEQAQLIFVPGAISLEVASELHPSFVMLCDKLHTLS
jgi:hypothetical protein